MTDDEIAVFFGHKEPPGQDAAELLLSQALQIVTGARRKSYGKPEDNFQRIADYWNVYIRQLGLDFTDPEQGLTPTNISALMVLMKIARLVETPDHADSWRDTAGYAACGARCAGADMLAEQHEKNYAILGREVEKDLAKAQRFLDGRIKPDLGDSVIQTLMIYAGSLEEEK